jgi:hypothetical protein
MPEFGLRSIRELSTCDERLQRIFNEVVKYFDCTVIEGHRGEEAQNKAFDEGRSKLKYPNGKHNKIPSLAVDVMPFPIDWKNNEQIAYFAGQVVATARTMGITLRWGHDFNMNNKLNDQKFIDAPHYEIED